MGDRESQKRRAAVLAVDEVRSGMRVGLGTGSTARFAVLEMGARLRDGRLSDVVGVATSQATQELAQQLGIPLLDWTDPTDLDLAIDGADEVDPNGQLIKGGGGALLREKAVERRARRFLVVVDESKLSPKLGSSFALPVEVAPDAWSAERDYLRSLGADAKLRGGEAAPFVTDNGNVIIDARFDGGIDDPHALARALDARAAVRAHGLFLDMASRVLVGGDEGVRTLDYRT